MKRAHCIDAGAAAALVSLVLLLYRKVLRLWWTYDDANILRTISDYTFRDLFTNRNVWPQQLFTPLLMAAFEAERASFGLDMLRWYYAHLVLVCLMTLSVYAAMRLFFDVGPALAGAALFAAGGPLCSIVTQLSTVHYLLAITLAALTTIAYVVALRKDRQIFFIVSAVLYSGAMLAKEVAVPLPLFLLSVPIRDVKFRLRHSIGHGVALVSYLLWRKAVIGTFLGAYGWVIELREWPRLLLLLPWRLVRAASGTHLNLGLLLIAVMAMVICTAMRSRKALIVLVAAVAVVMGPLLPVAKEVNRRYVVVPWLAASVAFAASTTRFRSRRHAAALLILTPLLAIPVNRQEWAHEFGARLRMSDEARFFFEMPTNGLLRRPSTPAGEMRELNWVKTVYLHEPAGASWFYDDFFLCGHNIAGKRIWEYDPSVRAVVEITPRVADLGRHYCASIKSAPLSVRFEFRKPALYWDLGPYPEGRYTVLLNEGVDSYEVPRHDALNLPGATGLDLRVRYDSPAGWVTYSPEIVLDLAHHPDFTWRR